ncbi:MAG: RDD family protein [Pyrinomonadaceae bacterium]
MASAVQRPVAAIKPIREKEKIVGFSPDHLVAPFVLRCVALFIDYMVLLLPPIGWLLISRLMSDSTTGASVGPGAWILGILLFIADFLVLPIFHGQTVGKMAVGLSVVNLDGTFPGLSGIVRRNIAGYLVTVLTLGVGFLIAALNTSGRALHDLIAGTIVVRGVRKQV